MPLYKTEAIVLKRINLAEADLIVTFFTRSFGKVQCVAKRARKIKSRYGGRFEPFTCLNIIYSGKEHQNLFLLNHCDTVKPFYNLRGDYTRLTTGFYFSEIINSFIKEAERNEELFNLFFRVLGILEKTVNISVLIRLFEMRTIALSGFAPRLNSCLICQNEPVGKYLNFNFQRGGIICGKCLNGSSPGRRLTLGTLNYLKKIMSINLDAMDRLKFPKGLDQEISIITQIYLKTILGKEFKSYKFLNSSVTTQPQTFTD